MSTLKATYLQHPSASSANVTLASDGKATFNGAMVGAGMDLITTSTFSAVSSVSINNCFTSTYENYRIVMNFISTSAGVQLRCRLRSAGTDNSGTGAYESAIFRITAVNSTQIAYSAADTTGYLMDQDANGYGHAILDISSPYSAVYSRLSINGAGGLSGTAIGCNYVGGFAHRVNSSFDGITLYLGSGTAITGTVRVYGYRNS